VCTIQLGDNLRRTERDNLVSDLFKKILRFEQNLLASLSRRYILILGPREKGNTCEMFYFHIVFQLFLIKKLYVVLGNL